MLTTIKELFEKPIDRRINPAVVVDHTDSETIQTEIDEYVFTNGLTEQLYKLLNTLGSKTQTKTGIWINGYYGSGKSHFLKFVSYCLSDQHQATAFDRFIEEGIKPLNTKGKLLTEATPANAQNLLNRLRGSGTEVIMFNVEAVSPDSIKNQDKFLHILLRQFNKHRGLNSTNIPLALLLENHLQQNGLFEQFIQAVDVKYGKNWREKATDLLSIYGINVVKLAAEVDPSIDADMLFQKLKQPDAITIEDTLIPELRTYIQGKPANYRLVFLLDEVSQYIGRNGNLLLNLQTIIEALEKACNRQVWVACTAQQTLEEVTSTAQVTKEDEIGKILGRFETRIALDNKDAELITQKRVLDKNASGQQELQQRYRQHSHAIQNQFSFGSNTTYRGFADEAEFIRIYPFVPYQFPLILNVFEAFSTKGYVVREVKNNERSVLGITHATIKNFADKPLDEFVPFDAFFNDLFRNNLLQVAQQSIYRAEQSLDKSGKVSDLPFAKRVLRALFMLANLSTNEARKFPATRDQLVTLLMTGLDDNRLKLGYQTQEVLDVLMAENIIYLTDDAHFAFFKEEEIEVANQIRNTTVLELDRLDNWNDVLLKNANLNKETRYTFGKNTFRLGYGVDRKDYGTAGDVQIRFFVMDGTDAGTLALNQPANELAVCIGAWLNDSQNPDKEFVRDFETYIRTRKYLSLYYNAATGSMSETLRDFQNRNEAREKSLVNRLKAGFASVTFVAGQQRINPADLTGNQPDVRLKGAIERLFSGVYKYQSDVSGNASTNDELRNNARTANQTSTNTGLTAAEQRVEDWINNRGGKATVSDLIKAFEDRPFGWKDISTIDVLLGLMNQKRKEIEYQGGPFNTPTDFVEKALKSSERSVLLVRTTEDIAPQLIQEAIRAYGQVFNKTLNLAPDATAVQGELKTELTRQVDRLNLLAVTHAGLPFAPALTQLVDALRTLGAKRDAKVLFETLVAQSNDLRTQCDAAKEISAFVKERLDEYMAMRQFVIAQVGNFSSLPPQEAQQATDLHHDLLNNATPQEAFALNRKRFQAVKRAIGDSIAAIRQQVKGAYEAAFDELEAQCTQHGLDDPHVLADRDQTLRNIDKMDSLTDLNLKLARVGDFKADQSTQLIEAVNRKAPPGSLVREPVTFEYGKQSLPAQIATETELDSYIAQLRQLLKSQLDQNKIIILK